jgi:hypothetical protein
VPEEAGGPAYTIRGRLKSAGRLTCQLLKWRWAAERHRQGFTEVAGACLLYASRLTNTASRTLAWQCTMCSNHV